MDCAAACRARSADRRWWVYGCCKIPPAHMLLLGHGVPGCPNRPAPTKRVKFAVSGA